ncbi:MAG: cation diffusion facilitator family transporter [Actinomycetota bacterium]|nr:cation diffusion facilitator family transporter [Actinomycetota bacterium]
MAHNHNHHNEGRLGISLLITCVVMLAVAAGGFFSNSLALLSDAGHMFTDVFALGMSLMAARISTRSPDHRATFGYHRVGLLAAIINGLALFAISFLIFYEGYRRLAAPPHVKAGVMLGVAVLGMAANSAMAMLLRHGHHDLNIRSAWMHVIGDLLSSAGVLASSLIIIFTGWAYADPAISFVIGCIILVGGLRVVAESAGIFLELSPRGISVHDLAKEICSMSGVMGVHDVHLWSLTRGSVFFSAHIWVQDEKLSKLQEISHRIKSRLAAMGVGHATLEFQCAGCEGRGIFCEVEEGHEHHDEEEHEHPD